MKGSTTRLLQATIALAALIPVLIGASGLLNGLPSITGTLPAAPQVDLDSHFRYLSGIFLGAGLAFFSCIPEIESKTGRFRLLAGLVVLGGIGRAISAFALGLPSLPHILGLGMELLVVPLLVLWQARVARRQG